MGVSRVVGHERCARCGVQERTGRMILVNGKHYCRVCLIAMSKPAQEEKGGESQPG